MQAECFEEILWLMSCGGWYWYRLFGEKDMKELNIIGGAQDEGVPKQ